MPRKASRTADSAPLAYENQDFLDSPDGRMFRIMAEYQEPMARFRRERIQDTVVFFGSARFRALDVASQELELLDNTGSAKPAPADEQPARPRRSRERRSHELKLKLAEAAVEMARYYEDARTLAGHDYGVGDDAARPPPPLRHHLRRRARHHGGRQPRRLGGGREDHRPEHQAALRAVCRTRTSRRS